mgnify:CR=1 FL=1
MNGTAFAFPPDDKASGAFAGQDVLGGLEDIGDPSKLFENFTSDGSGKDDTTIKSVTPTVYRNRAALEILATTTKEGKSYDAKAIVFTQPTRIAHIEGEFPPEEGDKNSPFGQGRATMDFFYDAEVKTKVPEKMTRAAGLAYSSGQAMGFGGSDDGSAHNATWTFLHSGGVKLDEVTVEIKDESSDDQMNGMAPPDGP